MTVVAISQRVVVEPRYGERRDALDQNWIRFLARCGIIAAPVPNVPESVETWIETFPVTGVLLTGGNDLVAVGGTAPERDATEAKLIDFARGQMKPLLGVCRGMQMIQQTFDISLVPVKGHVTPGHAVKLNDADDTVNSYHDFGSRETVDELEIWAVADDGIIEAVRHTNEPIQGFMWHPERFNPFRPQDIAVVSGFFGSRPAA